MFTKHFLYPSLLLAMLVFTQCSETEPLITPPTPNVNVDNYGCDDQPTACELIEANNSFGFNIFQKLHEEKPDSNIFISPLSISTALTMTLNGADGETKTQMHNTLELEGLSLDEVNNAYQYVLTALPALDANTELQLANSIWHDLDFAAHTEFLDVNANYFNSTVEALDFKEPSSVDVINGWVSDNTNGLIEDILLEIPPDAVMYLINAIYFKGAWRFPFDSEFTVNADFYVTPEQTVPVDRMGYGAEVMMPYFQNELFQAVDLPYGDSTFSMTVFLPLPNQTMDDIVATFDTETYNQWVNGFENKRMNFFMPKFEMEYEKKLNDILIDLGMVHAFDGRADLSKLGPGGLYISMVKHKSFVEVNEEGTEAAAATVVEIAETSVGLFVDLNRPFLFVIRENITNSVLFMGKMMNPAE